MTSRIAQQRSHVYSAIAAIGFAATSGAWLTMGYHLQDVVFLEFTILELQPVCHHMHHNF